MYNIILINYKMALTLFHVFRTVYSTAYQVQQQTYYITTQVCCDGYSGTPADPYGCIRK